MIDLANETLLTLDEATTHVPRRNGRKPHRATIRRWVDRGIGGERLEAIKCGGSRMTSAEAIRRFFERLNAPGAIAPSAADAERAERVSRQAAALLGMSS